MGRHAAIVAAVLAAAGCGDDAGFRRNCSSLTTVLECVGDAADVAVYLDGSLAKTAAAIGTFACRSPEEDGAGGDGDSCFARDPVHPGGIEITAGFIETDLPGHLVTASCRHSLKVEIALDDLEKLVTASRIPLKERTRAWFYRYGCNTGCDLADRTREWAYSPTGGVLLVDAAGPTTFEFRLDATFAPETLSADTSLPPQAIEVRAAFYSCQVMEVEACGT